jgi:hypothetical protein
MIFNLYRIFLFYNEFTLQRVTLYPKPTSSQTYSNAGANACNNNLALPASVSTDCIQSEMDSNCETMPGMTSLVTCKLLSTKDLRSCSSFMLLVASATLSSCAQICVVISSATAARSTIARSSHNNLSSNKCNFLLQQSHSFFGPLKLLVHVVPNNNPALHPLLCLNGSLC